MTVVLVAEIAEPSELLTKIFELLNELLEDALQNRVVIGLHFLRQLLLLVHHAVLDLLLQALNEHLHLLLIPHAHFLPLLQSDAHHFELVTSPLCWNSRPVGICLPALLLDKRPLFVSCH